MHSADEKLIKAISEADAFRLLEIVLDDPSLISDSYYRQFRTAIYARFKVLSEQGVKE